MKTKCFALCFILLASCGGDDLPEGVLPAGQIVPVIVDIYLLEGMIDQFPVRTDSAKILFEMYQKNIFEKYHITDSIYRYSMGFYYGKPEALDPIIDAVLDSLNLKDERLKKAREKELQKFEQRRSIENQDNIMGIIKRPATVLDEQGY